MGAHVHCLSSEDIYNGDDRSVADFTSKPQPFYWWNKDFTYKMTGPEGENLYANNWPVKKDIEIDNIDNIHQVTKFVLYFENLEDRVSLYEDLNERGFDVELSSSHKNNGEVNPKNINKGYAVEHLSKLANISLDETLVLGDNFNDLTMLDVCPNSVTLKTAPLGVRQTAKIVLDRKPSQFVADAIRMFINNRK